MVKKLECEYCGKTFKSMQGLASHRRNVHGESKEATQQLTKSMLSFFRCLDKGNSVLDCCYELNLNPNVGEEWEKTYLRLKSGEEKLEQLEVKVEKIVKDFYELLDMLENSRCPECGAKMGIDMKCTGCDIRTILCKSEEVPRKKRYTVVHEF